MDGILHDLRCAIRSLRQAPAFSVVAVVTLALGIGANAAIFTVIRAVLLKSLPYADADRLVLLGETRPDASNYGGAISAPNYLDWVQQNTVFEQMAAVTGGGVTLSGGTNEPVYVDGRSARESPHERVVHKHDARRREGIAFVEVATRSNPDAIGRHPSWRDDVRLRNALSIGWGRCPRRTHDKIAAKLADDGRVHRAACCHYARNTRGGLNKPIQQSGTRRRR